MSRGRATAGLPAEQFEALREAAREGVQFDGLYAYRGQDDYDRDPDGYAFGTPTGEVTDLSESEFHERAETDARYVTNWYYWQRIVEGEGSHRRAFLRWLERAPVEGAPGSGGVGAWLGAGAEAEAASNAAEVRAEARDAAEGCADPIPDAASPSEPGGAGSHGSETEAVADPEPGGLSVPDRYARLSDGIRRTWGQLLITTTLDADGRRRYEVRHEDDADVPADELETYGDPLEARELSKLDERDRYRPLRTAPTLRTGWAFADLDGNGVVECVDNFYPATIANWHRERRGELDVSHWDKTAERQTGIYDLIDELDADAVNRIAETCCVDSQCLKRRQWDKNEETVLTPDRGDGEFPCREPCSLVIAAAREWTKLEREEARTYEFELTPSEKEQIEAIIDAVADGRADEIREADVYEGANRYRTRYLRAKRFDEEGNLSGTPTDEE